MAENNTASPWRWIPTLYIAEGLPYVAVNVLTVMIYFQMGIPKAEMAFYTGWLYLPWVIKPFWSPFVDIISTKRRWTIAMQWLMAAMMGSVGFLLPLPFFFSATLVAFWLLAFFSATHDIAADGYYMLELDKTQQAAFVGVRSTFYRIANVMGQGGLVILAGWLLDQSGSPERAWSLTFYFLALLFALIALYHSWGMPRSSLDRPQISGTTAIDILRGFATSFVSFFQKPGIWLALAFILLYRIPEALCLKLVVPFLMDSREAGGLALTASQVGAVNGTVGVISLLAGGIVGGLAIAAGGLRRWLWPMALALTLPCVVYCYMAQAQPEDIFLISALIGIEQFGYGFGFTAFMMYLIYFSRGEMQTSHYAFCTAFMALGMMLPGMGAGWLHDILAPLRIFGCGGYASFFLAVMASCLLTYIGCIAAMRTLREGEMGSDVSR